MSLSRPNDFGEDVLAILLKRKILLHGCRPQYLEYHANGDLKMWFYGTRNNKPWRGGITIQKRPEMENALLRGDSNIFAEAVEKIIDNIGSEFM